MNLTKEELIEIVTDFSKDIISEDSTNKCFMVCSPLVSYLSFINLNVKLVKGDFKLDNNEILEHYWIECEDFIIDPTCDQLNLEYNLPKLECPYIGDKPNWYPSSK